MKDGNKIFNLGIESQNIQNNIREQQRKDKVLHDQKSSELEQIIKKSKLENFKLKLDIQQSDNDKTNIENILRGEILKLKKEIEYLRSLLLDKEEEIKKRLEMINSLHRIELEKQNHKLDELIKHHQTSTDRLEKQLTTDKDSLVALERQRAAESSRAAKTRFRRFSARHLSNF